MQNPSESFQALGAESYGNLTNENWGRKYREGVVIEVIDTCSTRCSMVMYERSPKFDTGGSEEAFILMFIN